MSYHRFVSLVAGLLIAVLISWFWARSMSHTESLFGGFTTHGAGIRSFNGELIFWAVKDDPFLGIEGIIWNSTERNDEFNSPIRNWWGRFGIEQTSDSIRFTVPHWVFVTSALVYGITSAFWKTPARSDSE